MKGQERQKGGFLEATRAKVRESLRKCTRASFTYEEAAVLSGVSAAELRVYEGDHLGLGFFRWGIEASFTPQVSLNKVAYQKAVYLLQETVRGMGDRAVATLEREDRSGILEELKKSVPGFRDLVTSVSSVADWAHEEQMALLQARVAFWYESLPPGIQDRLIPPGQIFTQPG